ncbi:cyclin-D1-binding protein 1 homolog [Liolophura sinensis]|uniref:cyclin-D1-binding protein 1 homolog n=1 Tax=Liolophura sinensis TaxID=3198878 RepID=UPI003158C2E5
MAARHTLCNVFSAFIDNLRLVERQLLDGDTSRGDSADFDRQAFWDRLGTSVQAVSAEVTKLSMVFSKPPVPPVEHCEQIIGRVEKATLMMVSAFYSLPKSQGLRLRRSIRNAVIEVVQSVIGLGQVLNTQSLGSPDQLKSTACVWQCTDSFSSLPKDNRELVLTLLGDTASLVKDAADELQEAVDSGLEDDFGDSSNEQILAEDNSNKWSDHDKALVKACLGLTKVCQSVLKKSSEAVRRNGHCDSDANIAQFDDLADQVERLSPQVDELASNLYPPINDRVAEENSQKLAENLKSCLLFLRKSHVTTEDDAQWVDFLLTAGQHNLDKIFAATKDG